MRQRPGSIDEAISYLEDALSDLRWARRDGSSHAIAKAQRAIMLAEDELDNIISAELETAK